ncbi:MAG TPA: amidohydrolase family protein, partial [Caldimonas sp.]|nr:amidohydrolase family protein [Caldimonas sp.]
MSSDTATSFDLLIRGGTVVDGTRAPRFDADVGIAGGRIAAIGDLAGRPARETLNAAGRIVAPGFIDSHTHDDQALLEQPDMTFKVSQGVTTVVAGNCGISIAPLPPDSPLPSPLDLLDVNAKARFGTFASYFAQLERTPPAVNVAALVGHS